MIAMGPSFVHRAPVFCDLARRVPMLVHEDRGKFVYFLIGHPIV